jgi:predicted extracellular nuclease
MSLESKIIIYFNMLSFRQAIRLSLPFVLAAAALTAWFVCIPSQPSLAAQAYLKLMSVEAPSQEIPIHDIQGAAHRSPYEGQLVHAVQGVVTALRTQGFYLQETTPDGDDATSEGIFVHLGFRPSLAAGDWVSVTGEVVEDRPFSLSSGSLSVTQISTTITSVQVLGSGVALPVPVLIGLGGRLPPNQLIEDDAIGGNVETGGDFDPAFDGLDFYESLEAMRVQVNDPIAVSGTSQDGVIAIVGDGGAQAGVFTPRGGLIVRPDDFNPERLLVEDVIVSTEPKLNVGAVFSGAITGIMDYSLGNFKLYNTDPLPPLLTTGVVSETAATASPDKLSVATFNTENLDPTDSPTKFSRLARQIVHYLKSPDILALQEIQDDDGASNTTVVTADATYQTLIAAIQAAGGPPYQYRQIDPQDDQDGGALGGNIRVGFLFRSDRGLSLADHPSGDALAPVTATLGIEGIELSLNPGRIDPDNPAFDDSRKPLAIEFIFRGHRFFAIACHFNSKTGDSALFGRYQPPFQDSEIIRNQQAAVVNAFVQHILSLDPQANVIVLGDFNDFPFSSPLATLEGTVLTNLLEAMPANERYTYVFDGNSQALDQILVSSNLLQQAFKGVDIVHLNAEFAATYRPSDHDPVLARFSFDGLQYHVYLPHLSR